MTREIGYGEFAQYEHDRKCYINEPEKKLEVKKGETIIGNFLEMRNTRKEEVLAAEKAKIMASDDYATSIKLINKYSIKVNEIAHKQHEEAHKIEMKYWAPKHSARTLENKYSMELDEIRISLRDANDALENEIRAFVLWDKSSQILKDIKHLKDRQMVLKKMHNDAMNATQELAREHKHEIRMLEEKSEIEIGGLLTKLYDEAPMLIVLHDGKLVPKTKDQALANSEPIILSLEETYHKTIKEVSEKMLDTFAESNKNNQKEK